MTKMLTFELFPYPCFPFTPLVCAVAKVSETIGAVCCTESLCWTDLPWFAGSCINFFIFDSGRWCKSLKLTKDQNVLFVMVNSRQCQWFDFVLKLPICKQYNDNVFTNKAERTELYKPLFFHMYLQLYRWTNWVQHIWTVR